MPNNAPALLPALDFIVDRVDTGIFAINKNMEVVLWNKFMASNSGINNTTVIGKNIFEQFPQLPKKWLQRKIENVFILKNFAFTSWEQRPYLFKFPHRRPVTGNIDCMRQNCTFIPVKGTSGDIEFVCVTITDVTDTSIYQLQLQELTDSLAEMSNLDGLTNIYNRRYLEENLAKEFDRSKRYGEPLSLILMDIDHFKDINDQHGHLAGDEVLRQTVQRLKASIRNADILGRYGGEEFVAILPSTNLQGAQILAERLREKIAGTPIQSNTEALTVSISIGITTIHENIDHYEKLLNEADIALYSSKNQGRNQVTAFNASLQSQASQ